MPLVLTDEQKQRVLMALAHLPDLATVKQISEAAGFEVTLPAMKPLIAAGLVAMTEVKEPPVMRFSLAPAGRKWVQEQQAGENIAVPAARRPVDGPMTKASEEQLRELQRRVEAGEGTTPSSRQALASELGVTVQVVSGYMGQRQKRQVGNPEANAPANPPQREMPPTVTPPAAPQETVPPAQDTSKAQTEPVSESESGAAAHPRRRNSSEDVARLYARFDAGEGDTPASKEALAKDFGVSVAAIAKHMTNWRKTRKITAAVSAPATNAAPPPVPPNGRLTPDVRAQLYARFAAGEGQTVESRKALGREFGGILSTTVHYHLKQWEKAGRPGATPPPPDEPADLPATPPAAPQPDQAEPGEAPDGGDPGPAESVFSDQAADAETEHHAAQAQQGAVGVAFDGVTEAPKTEHSAPSTDQTTKSTGNDQSSTEKPDAAGDSGAMYEMKVTVTTLAPEIPQEKASKQVAALAAPQTAMAAALAKAGLALPGPGKAPSTLPTKPGRRLSCQVCHRPVDSILWHEAKGIGGHKECVEPAASLQAEESMPEVGQVYEGSVFIVSGDGKYAIVELLEFSNPQAKRYVRGKLSRDYALRRGECTDIRDWLKPGDLVNVRVLGVKMGPEKRKYSIPLSIKDAPAHRHERIPLEVPESPAMTEAAPIVTKGSDVAAQLVAAGDRQAIEEQAMAVIMTCHMEPALLQELTDRILAVGIDQATKEVEADLQSMADLKQQTSAEVGTATGLPSPKHPLLDEVSLLAHHEYQRQAEAKVAELEAQLAKVTAERDSAENVVLNLTAEVAELHQTAVGQCADCVHALDGFCPYGTLLDETYQLPDESLAERHKGKRITFGRRPVVDCELYRPEQTSDTAAD